MTWSIWLIGALIALGLEVASNGLILVFFALGAIATCVLAPWVNLEIQLGIFITVSLTSLVLFRQKLRDALQKPKKQGDPSHPLDEFIGKQALVVQDILGEQGGRIEIHGTTWKAKAKITIHSGQSVTITHHDQMDLWVQNPITGEQR